MIKVYLEQISGKGVGSSYALKKGTTILGRKEADIIIDDKRISSIHCEFHFSGTRVFLQDRNSTNGSFVNAKKVERRALKDGDVISVGGDGNRASAVFKLHIIREIPGKRKIVVVVKERIIASKKIYIPLIIIPVLFFLWLIIPFGDDFGNLSKMNFMDVSNIEDLEPVPLSQGVSTIIALDDEILLPEDKKWQTEVRYEQIEDTEDYENRLYIVDLWTVKNTDDNLDDMIVASITLQRFKSDFTGKVAEKIYSNFLWHEKKFLSDNKISQKFMYSKTKSGIWQWVIWQDGTKYNLYATCVTTRGRIMLQASAYDAFWVKRFFQYVASTYKEGHSY